MWRLHWLCRRVRVLLGSYRRYGGKSLVACVHMRYSALASRAFNFGKIVLGSGLSNQFVGLLKCIIAVYDLVTTG